MFHFVGGVEVDGPDDKFDQDEADRQAVADAYTLMAKGETCLTRTAAARALNLAAADELIAKVETMSDQDPDRRLLEKLMIKALSDEYVEVPSADDDVGGGFVVRMMRFMSGEVGTVIRLWNDNLCKAKEKIKLQVQDSADPQAPPLTSLPTRELLARMLKDEEKGINGGKWREDLFISLYIFVRVYIYMDPYVYTYTHTHTHTHTHSNISTHITSTLLPVFPLLLPLILSLSLYHTLNFALL